MTPKYKFGYIDTENREVEINLLTEGLVGSEFPPGKTDYFVRKLTILAGNFVSRMPLYSLKVRNISKGAIGARTPSFRKRQNCFEC